MPIYGEHLQSQLVNSIIESTEQKCNGFIIWHYGGLWSMLCNVVRWYALRISRRLRVVYCAKPLVVFLCVCVHTERHLTGFTSYNESFVSPSIT